MKAFLMAGGLGERLRPLTNTIPKPMIEVGGKPVLEHIVEHLRSYGFTEIMVKTHWLHEQIMNYFGSSLLYKFEPDLMGTADSLRDVRHWFDDEILVMNGDTLTDINLSDFVTYHRHGKHSITFAVNEANNHCAGAMLFDNPRAFREMSDASMIDEAIEGVQINKFFGVNYFDIGTPEKLERARKHYENKS